MSAKLLISALSAVFALGTLVHTWGADRADLPIVNPTPTPELASTHNNPVELGAVHWLRDLSEGVQLARQSGKPLLILFQEVPGCSNCTRYGNGPLRHPLLVEAIETFFVPVCIYNNKGGKDGEALRQFNEPAWNNPVVRIVSPDHRDVVPRIANFASPYQLLHGIIGALQTSGQTPPAYLELLAEEWQARESGIETATFSMYCFWSGEGTFGAISGVIETEPGFQNGREVVKVQFDPAVVSKADLESRTQPKGIAACARNEGFRSDQTPKYYLSNTEYRYLPMTPTQACRANSMIGANKNPDALFSPRQLALLQRIKKQPDQKWKNQVGARDLAGAWAALTE